jgi:hypothetical protein
MIKENTPRDVNQGDYIFKFEVNDRDLLGYESISDRVYDYINIFDDKNNKITPEFKQFLNNFIAEKKYLAEKSNNEEAKSDLIALSDLYFKLHSPENKKGYNNTQDEIPEEKIKPSVKIFTMDPDQDYSEIGSDIGFDKWITNIDTSLRADRVDLSSEVKDVKEWYTEYQETISYREKLDVVFEYTKKTAKDNIELLAAQDKIENLIYKIHTEGEIAKNEIYRIFNSYTESKENEAKVESLQKTKLLRDAIEATKNKGGSFSRKITSEQVKQILESRGEQNTAENLNELTNFLGDFQENYDFYSSGTKEDGDNNIRYVYEKYKAVGRKNTEPRKIKSWSLGKLWSRVVASIPRDVDDQDKYNQFIGMTTAIRNFDLVDRKNGNKTKTEQNKQKMSEVIHFCRDNSEMLDKYLTDKNSVDVTSIESDPEKKKLFETTLSLYKTYTQGKYRTPEAKSKAEKILAEDKSLEIPDEQTPTLDMLYAEDREMFETNATLSVNRKTFTALNTEIETLIKSKAKKEIPELEKIHKRFEAVKAVLEKIGSNKEKEALKTTELKLSVLRLKNINTENLKDLSDSFPTYEYILASTEKTVAEKTEYIKVLIENLEKLRSNDKNTMVQNFQLDAIIEKYQKVLKSIK